MLIPFYCISNQHMQTPVCRQWGHLLLHSRWPQSWRCQSDTKEIPHPRPSGTGVLQNLHGNQLSLESRLLLLLGRGMFFRIGTFFGRDGAQLFWIIKIHLDLSKNLLAVLKAEQSIRKFQVLQMVRWDTLLFELMWDSSCFLLVYLCAW